jgi:hypothetical protein
LGQIDELCNRRCSFGLHAWDHVGVPLHGEGRVLVAEAFADDLDPDACLECDRCVGVAKLLLSSFLSRS